MGEIDGYRYSFCVYGGHTYVVQLIPVEFDLEATRRFRRVYWYPYPLPVCRVCYNLLGISLWGTVTLYSCSGVY